MQRQNSEGKLDDYYYFVFFFFYFLDFPGSPVVKTSPFNVVGSWV